MGQNEVKRLEQDIKYEQLINRRKIESEELCDSSFYEEFDDDFHLYSGKSEELEDYDYSDIDEYYG